MAKEHLTKQALAQRRAALAEKHQWRKAWLADERARKAHLKEERVERLRSDLAVKHQRTRSWLPLRRALQAMTCKAGACRHSLAVDNSSNVIHAWIRSGFSKGF